MITPLCSQVRCYKLKQLPPASHGGMCERLKQAVLKIKTGLFCKQQISGQKACNPKSFQSVLLL